MLKQTTVCSQGQIKKNSFQSYSQFKKLFWGVLLKSDTVLHISKMLAQKIKPPVFGWCLRILIKATFTNRQKES